MQPQFLVLACQHLSMCLCTLQEFINSANKAISATLKPCDVPKIMDCTSCISWGVDIAAFWATGPGSWKKTLKNRAPECSGTKLSWISYIHDHSCSIPKLSSTGIVIGFASFGGFGVVAYDTILKCFCGFTWGRQESKHPPLWPQPELSSPLEISCLDLTIGYLTFACLAHRYDQLWKQMCHQHEHLNVDRTTNCLSCISCPHCGNVFFLFFAFPSFNFSKTHPSKYILSGLLDWEPTFEDSKVDGTAATRYEKFGSCALNLHGSIVRLQGGRWCSGTLRPSCLWVDFERLTNAQSDFSNWYCNNGVL